MAHTHSITFSSLTYREIKWSSYGEAVARLQGLCGCVAATVVCSGRSPFNTCIHDELVFSYYRFPFIKYQ